MNFSELAKKRQSTRKYIDQPVEHWKLDTCIETARLSPSACNSQPWKFVVVTDTATVNDIGEACTSMGMNSFARQSPVFVAVVLEKMNLSASIGSVIKDKEYSLLDIGIAVNQFCLQATELELGTCIIGWFNEKKVHKILNVPRSKRIPILIAVGYSNISIRPKSRKPTEQICSWEKYE
jgi:nitroreductase